MIVMPEKLRLGVTTSPVGSFPAKNTERSPTANVGPAIVVATSACPADISERSAIIQEGHGCSRSTADAQALAEAGFASPDAFTASVRGYVLAEVTNVEISSLREVQRLTVVTRAFVDSEHFRAAIAHGWSVHELFAAHRAAPVNNLAGMGLVTHIALLCLGARLEIVTEDRAVLRAKSGGTLTYNRFVPRLEGSLLWWEVPCLSSGASAAGRQVVAA